jgi:hypothetical protein
MSDENAIAKTEEEPIAITLREFLENVPPQQAMILNEIALKIPSRAYLIKLPEIDLYCGQDSCNRKSIFRVDGEDRLTVQKMQNSYVQYLCSHCRNKRKIFSLRTIVAPETRLITIIKYGELPPDEEPTPPKLLRMFDADRELYLKGRRCEKQGLGIGAAAYYRRVVERQKDRFFDEIIKACEKIGAKEEIVEAIRGEEEHAIYVGHRSTRSARKLADRWEESVDAAASASKPATS